MFAPKRIVDRAHELSELVAALYSEAVDGHSCDGEALLKLASAHDDLMELWPVNAGRIGPN